MLSRKKGSEKSLSPGRKKLTLGTLTFVLNNMCIIRMYVHVYIYTYLFLYMYNYFYFILMAKIYSKRVGRGLLLGKLKAERLRGRKATLGVNATSPLARQRHVGFPLCQVI